MRGDSMVLNPRDDVGICVGPVVLTLKCGDVFRLTRVLRANVGRGGRYS